VSHEAAVYHLHFTINNQFPLLFTLFEQLLKFFTWPQQGFSLTVNLAAVLPLCHAVAHMAAPTIYCDPPNTAPQLGFWKTSNRFANLFKPRWQLIKEVLPKQEMSNCKLEEQSVNSFVFFLSHINQCSWATHGMLLI